MSSKERVGAAGKKRSRTRSAPAAHVPKPAVKSKQAAKATIVKWYEKLGRWFAASSLPEIVFITTFILARYWSNSDFSYPFEIIVPVLMFAVLVTIVFVIYRLILRRNLTAHVASLLLCYFGLYAYQFTSQDWYGDIVMKFVPNSASAMVHSIVFVAVTGVLCGAIGYGFGRLTDVKALRRVPVLRIVLFAILFLFVSESVRVASRVWHIRNELSYHYTATTPSQDKSAIKGKPNVYYLLFDRYGNSDTLKNIYDYDNSGLTNYLADEGFYNRPSAYDNYPFTMSSTSSTLAMAYFPEFQKMFGNDGPWQSAFPYRSILNKPPAAELFRANGYSYNQVSSWWDFTRAYVDADTAPTKSFRLNLFNQHIFMSDLQRDIINKSIFSPWLKKGLTIGHTTVFKYDRDTNPRENFEAQMSALKNIAVDSAKTGPQFTFAHVLAPHDPYIFDAEGNDPDYDGARNDAGLDETEKYTNEVTYLNTRIQDLITTIRTKDPGAAIVIQADEGPYPKEFRFTLKQGHFYNPVNLPVPQMKQKFGVLASYYMPGVDQSTVEQNITASVNPFRFVLSHYLGYDLPPLADCHFATGDKFEVYNYTLLNQQLTGQPAPAECDNYK